MTIAGGRDVAFDEAEWRDAIVVIERGSLDIECLGGNRSTFATGAVLCLDRLQLRTLHNAGNEPVLLFAVSRAGPDLGSGPVASNPGRPFQLRITPNRRAGK
jgi:hypothetical protein